MESHFDLNRIAGRLPVEDWIDLCARSLEEPTTLDGVPLPTAPSSDLQKLFVGGAGRQTMLEAGKFYRYALEANERFRAREPSALLDFGCGWGRHTRLFLRDVPDRGLYGVDPQALAIQTCRRHVPYACFMQTETRPPLPFRDQFFDVIISYSVFSHLSEINAANWVYELSRVLKPNGLLIATTHPRSLLDRVEQMQQGHLPAETTWHKVLMRSWPDVSLARDRYDRGEFVFAETGEYGHRDGYGDVLVPKQYVWDVWGKILEPLEFLWDQTRVHQAVFVMRKCA